MPRARSPNRERAYRLWAESGGKRKLKDIAAEIGVAPELLRKWKSADAWEKGTLPNGKSNVTKSVSKRKRGGQPGNRNAVGKTGGPPLGSSNALKHGGYSPVYWDTLTDEEKALLDSGTADCETLLREEIELLSVRERRILERIRKIAAFDDKTPTGLGLVVSGVIRNEEKREFDAPEDKALYEAAQRAKVESGNLLPGHKYSVSTRTEATYDVIHRLEEALTRCQAQKQKCIRNLMELRQTVKDGGEIDDAVRLEVEVAVRNAQSGNGPGSDRSISDNPSG